MKADALELADELLVIRRSVEVLRLVAELLNAAPRMYDSPAPASVAALADLVVVRLKLVERAVRGTIDPALLIHTHNSAVGSEGGVRLEAWGSERKKAEAERELRRLDFERRALKRRRR